MPVMGSIPAHAGQPARSCGQAAPARVHPRSRGAAAVRRRFEGHGKGPSPLTRGSRRWHCELNRLGGSIPAHAGQPRSLATTGWAAGVHPRSRGAAVAGATPLSALQGPSPLTRGSLEVKAQNVALMGSIPAHAGQPKGPACAAIPCRVHPRSRGAAFRASIATPDVSGPSPLTRGSPPHKAVAHCPPGSIPAHAGQPWTPDGRSLGRWVHPRSRGAAREARLHAVCGQGPSPLTRGSHLMQPRPPVHLRSIPAHAGQPMMTMVSSAASGVHPRSRGAAG